MKVLVTGASGFIGRHLCQQLARDHQVFATLRRRDVAAPDGVRRVDVDLRHPDFENALPRADAVVALAQSPEYRHFPDGAEDMFEVNVRSVQRLLEWSRRSEIQHFLYTSSANVYPQCQQPISEDISPAPASFYARTKRMAETLVESYAEFFACDVFRLFTVYGPRQQDALVPNLIERIRGGTPVAVQGGDGLRLSPIYVTDVCHVLGAAVAAPPPATAFSALNVGGKASIGIRELAETIGALLGVEPVFDFRGGDEPGGWKADITRLHARFDLPPFSSLKQGLRDTVDATLCIPCR